jgi:hypothetical protein
LAFHLGREADHSPPPSAEVKEWVELYLHSPNMPSWRGSRLGGAQGIHMNFLLPHACYIRHVSHPSWFNCPYDRHIKLFIMQLSPPFCYFISPCKISFAYFNLQVFGQDAEPNSSKHVLNFVCSI